MAVWGAAQNDPGDWPFDSKHLETRPLKPSGLAGSRQLIARPGSPASPLNHSGGKGDLHSASRSKSGARATSREEIRFPIPIAGRGRSRLRPAICGAIVRKNSSTRPAATNCPNSVPRCAALEKWEASQSRRSSTQTGQPDMPGSAIASGCIDFVYRSRNCPHCARSFSSSVIRPVCDRRTNDRVSPGNLSVIRQGARHIRFWFTNPF